LLLGWKDTEIIMGFLKVGVVLAVLCCTSVLSKPSKPGNKYNPILTFPTPPTEQYNLTDPFPFLGNDIRLTADQARSGIIGENYRWRGGFFVQIDRNFNSQEYAIINNALYDLHINVCIDVLLWPSDAQPSGDYVFIERGGGGSGCWSYVGRLGGRQQLNLEAPGCVHQGVAIHEAIHAMGFFHEQSRPDRDEFVNILWGNINPDMAYNFNKLSWGEASTFDVPYDYRSIMHYNAKDFSNNGGDTIQAWNGSPVGSQNVMTGNDHNKLRRMYNC